MLTLAQIVLVFLTDNFASLAVVAIQIGTILLSSKIPIKTYLRSIKMVLFFVSFTTILNLFYGSGEALVSFWMLKITQAGINNSIFVTVRVTALIFISSALTYTTSPTDLCDGIERLMKPLVLLRINVHEIAMMMSIALRFIPTLIEETDKIMSAQKARGADFESGNLIRRVKSLMPILIPLFISSFRRAYDLAIAMECRCYQGGKGRSRMKILRVGLKDVWAICVVCSFYLITIACNIILKTAVR
jgi:energy-coupling factor transport system permease protein